MPTISATFDTRREAELAVEHLVQEYEIDRDDVGLATDGEENSVGSAPSGSDEGTVGEDADDDGAALNGSIILTVTVEDEDEGENIQDTLLEYGGSDISIVD